MYTFMYSMFYYVLLCFVFLIDILLLKKNLVSSPFKILGPIPPTSAFWMLNNRVSVLVRDGVK